MLVAGLSVVDARRSFRRLERGFRFMASESGVDEEIGKIEEVFFCEEGVGSGIEGGDGPLGFLVLSHDDDAGLGVGMADGAGGGEAIHHGHLDIHDDPVWTVVLEAGDGLASIFTLQEIAARTGDHISDEGAGGRMIIDDQNKGR